MPVTGKLRVLHSVLSLETGGLENGVVNLVNRAPEYTQVDVLCLRAIGDLASRIENPSTNILVSPYRDKHTIIDAVRAHLKVIREGNYDIVHTHGWTTMLTGAVAVWFFRTQYRSTRPLIINGEHGVYYADHWRRRLLQRWLFNHIDGNLAVSSDLGYRMEQVFGLRQGTFTPILNGVDTALFCPRPEMRQKKRQDFGFDENNIVIGTVGRLVPVKNYSLLLSVFSDLAKQNHKIRLVFCGDGIERMTLEKQAKALGIESDVVFTGKISDVADAMQAFDIFALSSDMEGLPNTLLEAMASGIPALVTDVGGSREVIPNEGGFLVPANDETAYFEKLQQLVEDTDLRCHMAKVALEHARRCFSIQSMADQYYDYYQQLIVKQRS